MNQLMILTFISIQLMNGSLGWKFPSFSRGTTRVRSTSGISSRYSTTTGRGNLVSISFNNRMRIILPPKNGFYPHITGYFGEQRPNGTHNGVDFNYNVPGQRGINLQHPNVYSPVSGTVTFAGGLCGTIKIRTKDNYSHEILDLHKFVVKVNDNVTEGTIIGTMGGTGPKGLNHYEQHVHYQIKDPRNKIVNPETFTNTVR